MKQRAVNVGSVERCQSMIAEMRRDIRNMSDRDFSILLSMENSAYADQGLMPMTTERRARIARFYLKRLPDGKHASDAKKYAAAGSRK